MGDDQLGKLEDPAEDLFVSLIPTDKGNFRVFGGIAEGAAFYLQRFISVVNEMPQRAPFDGMRTSIYSLLTLSEAVAERAGISRHADGEQMPLRQVPSATLSSLAACRQTVTFTDADLAKLGIERRLLRPFAFGSGKREAMDSDVLGHSDLERRPLLFTEGFVVLALPTAVCAAVRRYVIEECIRLGVGGDLFQALVSDYRAFFRNLREFHDSPAAFRNAGGVTLASVMKQIDAGRWLHVVAVADGFDGYDCAGLSGWNSNPEALGGALAAEVRHAAEAAAQQPGFLAGLTLVVGCGWGRGLHYAQSAPPDAWRIDAISAHDLETLTDIPHFRLLDLWRTLDTEARLTARDVHLQNMNGLLNLVAWARRLDGHLVPHAHLPEDFGTSGTPAVLVIPQNELRDLRREVAMARDSLRLPDVQGRLVSVRRIGPSLFPEDNERPAYAADEEVRRGVLRGAFVTPRRTWWIGVEGSGSRRMVFKHWEMLHHWLGEAAPVIEATILDLPQGPIQWLANFDGLKDGAERVSVPVDPTRLGELLVVEADRAERTVHVRAAAGFQAAFQHPENVAEITLVEAFVAATARLAGAEVSGELLADMVRQIVPSPQARHLHMFEAREFRDFVRPALPHQYVAITDQDAAYLKLDLGLRARPPGELSVIDGKSACTAYLNSIVCLLEEDLCRELGNYGREALITCVLRNHEVATADSSRWARTSAAILALRRERESTLRAILQRGFTRNGVLQASRILIEAALCECPEHGNSQIGELDLSRLMATANAIVVTGGWSNAIRWDAMEPRLRLSPLGDILTASTFDEDVMEPFGGASGGVLIESDVSRYADHYKSVEPVEKAEALFAIPFVAAWRSEFGFDIDEARAVIDALEDLGIERNEVVMVMPRSDVVRIASGTKAGTEAGMRFVDALTFRSRAAWKQIPEGYSSRDRDPWRFRRRLSLLRLPLLQLDNGDDPRMAVAPGIVREAFHYLVRSFHEGDFDKSYAVSAEMRAWIGTANNKRGHEFNRSVAERMRELGWEAEADVKVTRLLRKGFPRDYGDIDVFAWNRETRRVLLMECKDLQFRKTYGEIAEQLADFRGIRDEKGRPDLLRKHLDRFEVITANASAVRAFIGFEPNLECHLVFHNPVPMQFLWEHLGHAVRLSLFRDLAGI